MSARAIDPAVHEAPSHFHRHKPSAMVLHWFNASCWLVQVITGLALIKSEHFLLAPLWFNHAVENLVGGRAALLGIHISAGLAWICVVGGGILLTKRGGAGLLAELKFHRDDLVWLMKKPLAMIGMYHGELPPQDKYNAGQKIYEVVVVFGSVALAFTGLIMTFHIGPQQWVQWAIPLHLAAMTIIICGLFFHLLMSALMKEERPALKSMVTGKITKEYVFEHNARWWVQELSNEAAAARGLGLSAAQPDPAPVSTSSTEAKQGVAPMTTESVPTAGERRRPEPFLSPFTGGIYLGLTLLAAYFILGTGLGASGTIARITAWLGGIFAPGTMASMPELAKYSANGANPLMYYMVFMSLGGLIGGFFAGLRTGRIKLMVSRGEHTTVVRRLVLALIGGIIVGFAARMSNGCTSGQALSGGAQLSLGSWIFMMAVFAGGFGFARFVRKEWL